MKRYSNDDSSITLIRILIRCIKQIIGDLCEKEQYRNYSIGYRLSAYFMV